jgi:biopolymer transport protein ExbD
MTNTNRAQRKSGNTKSPNESIPMTPMIDVVFQLLVFFIFTFQPIDALAEITVFSPGGCGVPGEVCSMNIHVDANQLRVNQQEFTQEELDKLLSSVADLNPSTSLFIVCAEKALHQELVTVLDLCNKHGLNKINMLYAASDPR